MSKKAVVLLSGGLDSCVTAAIARSQGYELHFLNVLYGQRHSRERESAQAIATFFNDGAAPVDNIRYLDVHGFGYAIQGASALTDKSMELPSDRSDEEMSHGKAPSYVPGRNTIMLALAQSYAEAIDADAIFCGVNAVDYSGYVDCRPAFIAAFNDLAQVATFKGEAGSPIWIEAPLIEMTKVDIVKKGIDLGAPIHLSWSCYTGGEEPCGKCDSCIIRNKALSEVGFEEDPFITNLRANEAQEKDGD